MANLYEINTLIWLGELSRKYGKPIALGNVPAREWDKLQKLGFDYVWLMGIWRRSKIGRKIAVEADELHQAYTAALPDWSPQDVAGSPYSVAAYQPDDLVGDWDDLAKARGQLERRGLGLILDFVPNHTAIDFPWAKKYPDRYITGTEEEYRSDPSSYVPITTRGRTTYIAKGRDPFFPPWHDTLQLNLFDAGTRAALTRIVKDLSTRCHGLRCDMAMLALNQIYRKTWGKYLKHPEPVTEFWGDLIAGAGNLLWIAEAYWETEWTLQQLGFDFVYDKRLYDRLRYSPPHDVSLHLLGDISFQSKLVRFLENHDEPRSAAVFARKRLEAAIILMATLPGMKMYYYGQFEGRRQKIPVQLTRVTPEDPDADLERYYHKILRISRHPAFSEGQWELLEPRSGGDDTYSNIIAYKWKTAGRGKVIAVNFSPQWSQARIPLKGDLPRETFELTDELNGTKYTRPGTEMTVPGLHVLLDGYQAHVLDIRWR
jgi:glycosidase